MPACCVFGCLNRTENSSNLHFYRIPVGSHPFQQRRRLLWLQAIKHVHWTEDLIKTARVCSQHFISGKASVESESPDFVPSVFPYTDQSRKLQMDHQSLQRKKTVDDAALPGEKRSDISVADDRPELAKARKSPPTSVPVMKKRKICDSVEIQPPKTPNASDTADPRHRPVKQFSKAEIQQLVKQEILASLQQSEHKMDELIRRIQKTDSIPKYDAIIFRLQADIKKIKRREQVALAYIRKIKPDTQAPPAGHTQQQALNSRVSPVCILDDSPPDEAPQAEPGAADNSTTPSSSRLSAEGDQNSLEASDMDGEVVFCGVRLPRKRIVEGFWQRRLKSNRVVDLTEDGEMISDLAPDPGSDNDPNQSQNGDPNRSQNEDSVESAQQDVAPTTVPENAAGTPQAQRANSALGTPNSTRTSTQPQRTQSSQDTPVSAGHTGADSQTTSNGVASSPQNDHRLAGTAVPPGSTPSSAEDDWRSKLPPLPTVPRPAELSPAVAGSQPPQQVTLTVARIKNPKGIGALWTLEKPDPKAAPVSRYHIYALQEALDGRFSAWRNVGTVRAMALPMACKLTDHGPGRRFCITVVSEDIFGRFGPYSQIQAIGPPE